MKIKLLTAIGSNQGSFNAGDIYTCASVVEANRYIKAGMAIAVSDGKKERAVKKQIKKEAR